jgi:hypothetical protein
LGNEDNYSITCISKEIFFKVNDPNGNMIISKTKQTSDAHTITANVGGKYTFCFGNEFSTSSSKKVGFNVHENIQKIHESVKGNLKNANH